MEAHPLPLSSSVPPEPPWRLVLMDATLGLELGALLLVIAVSVLRPSPGFDFLFWTVAVFALIVGVVWRARSLPMSVRGAAATLPALPVVYILSVRSGLLPGIPLAAGVLATLLALWYGQAAAILFNGAFAIAFLGAGYDIVAHHTRVDASSVDPLHFANWMRAALVFFSFSTVLAITMRWVVARVELHAEERREAYALLRRLYARLEGAKEEERRHLARELHDELGQVLTALRIRLQVALRSTDGTPAKLGDAVSLVDGLIVQVRKLSVDLSPPLLAEAGLVAAIRAHVESHPELSVLVTELTLDCSERLPETLEVAAFRVVQEALTNVVRHAGASRVRVVVRRDGDELFVSVADDGRGFDVNGVLQAAARGERFGFVGMRERVRGLGGILSGRVWAGQRRCGSRAAPRGDFRLRSVLSVPRAPPAREPMRILLADDHALVRAGIRALLDALPDVEDVVEAGDGRTALELVSRHKPDVALLDIAMPGLNGLDVAARIGKESPNTRLMILSMHSSPSYVAAALRAGATGYLLKEAAAEELPIALRAVMKGDTYLSPAISKLVVDGFLGRSPNAETAATEPSSDALTPRQREILQLVAEGKSTKEIASLLELSVKTVETHRGQLMDRLGIRDLAGLVRYAIRAGLVSSER